MQILKFYFLFILLGNAICQITTNWDICVSQKPKPCPLQCQYDGYLKFMIDECQPPIWSTCQGQKVCDPTRTDLYIKACTDYGYSLDSDGKCQPPDCSTFRDCSQIGTTYCTDLGYTQSADKCECIYPRVIQDRKCLERVFSKKLQTIMLITIFILYVFIF